MLPVPAKICCLSDSPFAYRSCLRRQKCKVFVRVLLSFFPLLFHIFIFVGVFVSQPADVPVHVHLVLAQGSTKTRAEYLEAEFAAIRAASTVSQLNQRIREAQKVS